MPALTNLPHLLKMGLITVTSMMSLSVDAAVKGAL